MLLLEHCLETTISKIWNYTLMKQNIYFFVNWKEIFILKASFYFSEINIGEIKSKIIVEAANIPMVPEMEDKLHERGTLVIPDLVANAGGVISSYAEYRGYNPSQLFHSIERKIKKNVKAVLSISKERGIKPRDAAIDIAKGRVEKAMDW